MTAFVRTFVLNSNHFPCCIRMNYQETGFIHIVFQEEWWWGGVGRDVWAGIIVLN